MRRSRVGRDRFREILGARRCAPRRRDFGLRGRERSVRSWARHDRGSRRDENLGRQGWRGFGKRAGRRCLVRGRRVPLRFGRGARLGLDKGSRLRFPRWIQGTFGQRCPGHRRRLDASNWCFGSRCCQRGGAFGFEDGQRVVRTRDRQHGARARAFGAHLWQRCGCRPLRRADNPRFRWRRRGSATRRARRAIRWQHEGKQRRVQWRWLTTLRRKPARRRAPSFGNRRWREGRLFRHA